MSVFINLTQHNPTQDQIAAAAAEGAVFREMREEHRKQVISLITFDDAPSVEDMTNRANQLAEIVSHYAQGGVVMIGGAPYFQRYLEDALMAWGHTPCYSFTKRVAVESEGPNGEVVKSSKFVHEAFIYVTSH